MWIDANTLLVLAVVLIAGAVGGKVARLCRLPAITGQILIGVLLGRVALGLMDEVRAESLRPVTLFALSLIAVTIGSHLNLRKLRSTGKRVALLLLLEATLTPLFVFGVIYWLSGEWTVAILLAGMAIATAPATIVALVKETRSKGIFVETLMASVALNNMACIALFEVARIWARVSLDPGQAGSAFDSLFGSFVHIVSSVALGVGVALALIVSTSKVVRPDRLAQLSLIAILLTAGLADYWALSPLLASLALGATLENVTPEKDEIGHGVFSDFEGALLSAFFTLAGAELDFEYLATGGVLAAGFVGARVVGKVLAGNFAMRMAKATDGLRTYLGWSLIPQAGVAIGLIILVQEDPALQSISGLILAVGIAAVTINEIIGPILTRYALVRSGDAGKDRARLIDFIHEQNITVELQPLSLDEAAQRLSDLLIRSNGLRGVSEGELVASVRERIAVSGLLIGAGIAVLHGELPEGSATAGAMGISREGLAVETPDGLPVHCVVLVATPPDAHERYREVASALLTAVGSDPNVRQLLYAATTPAHVYEVLHAREFEDYNYFLEDAPSSEVSELLRSARRRRRTLRDRPNEPRSVQS